MPTYEYVCAKCGQEFELFQAISEKPLTICPKAACKQKRWGRGRVKRKIGTGAGLLFKGSGFYITDYRSDGYKKAAKSESAAAVPSAGEGGQDGKTAPPKSEAEPVKGKADKIST